MEYTGCYRRVIELVDEYTARFSGYELNKEKYKMLRPTFDLIDKLVNEMKEMDDFQRVTISVEPVTKRLTISILCHNATFENGRQSVFFTLIQMVSSFSFSKHSDDALQIDLNIDGIWERKIGY